MLKTYAEPSSDARRVVEGLAEDDGWGTWRRLRAHFEPNLATREGQVLGKLAMVATRSAKHKQQRPKR